ncbi:hypothetical protein M9H77_04831 [Catharanthus roseus]|uniref:Uncharacterized protein n=1 Tax=Catharanthus roseus TaxID=4058 RepID=A0ACC0CF57_CATRO|nr:hypothetical protein M9H77_04831 [Catharanthus roseus]
MGLTKRRLGLDFWAKMSGQAGLTWPAYETWLASSKAAIVAAVAAGRLAATCHCHYRNSPLTLLLIAAGEVSSNFQPEKKKKEVDPEEEAFVCNRLKIRTTVVSKPEKDFNFSVIWSAPTVKPLGH